jgi:glycosyltransferase involved in cell wall biosynthesis
MPKVSVILPVYNGEKYLREAIGSILSQTYEDFEFIIINDGSTDKSEEIILSYKDGRIVYSKNEFNKGLIYSLNKSIELATGDLIARMDADDIAFPDRLQKQVDYFEKSHIGILASTVQLIDENGNPLPDWEDDIQNITFLQIRNYLLKNNCLAHPTILGSASLFKKYKYQENQKYSEDYDLWLRIIADNLKIEKYPEPLLLHRILPNSATRFKKINVFFRLAKVKLRFLWSQVRKGYFSKYIVKIFLYALADLCRAAGKEIKGVFIK